MLAHELCHVRRRDNLTSAIHMIVEAVFWFHPLVWWIGARLVEERERACDEAVLSLGNEPHDYAEGILNVCKSYLESPLACVSGVTGSNLKKRIQAILTGDAPGSLNFVRKFALAVAGMAALAVPVVVGVISAAHIQAQLATPKFEAPLSRPARLFKIDHSKTYLPEFSIRVAPPCSASSSKRMVSSRMVTRIRCLLLRSRAALPGLILTFIRSTLKPAGMKARQ